MHLTGAANSHEILVMPTLSLKEEEKDYAVCFALPLNTKGITIIFGRQATDTRRLEDSQIDTGNFLYGVVGGESLVVFDNVFVPEERIFMKGEYEFSGILVERFAIAHRQNYGACKVGISDVLIGAVALLSEYQGVEKAHHIIDKIVEMINLSETLHSCSLACSYEGIQTPSGAYVANPLYANVTKLNVTRFIYEIGRISHDISGGFIATMPSEKDLKNPEIKDYIEKYYKVKEGIPPEYRIRLGRLIENMTSGTPQVESMHGAGSPQTQKVVITRQAEIEYKKKIAREIAGIK
jgi:4-hydroxybutyryl-CoA dehydratase/vinylacetyl-CoA-Delta-isomerase